MLFTAWLIIRNYRRIVPDRSHIPERFVETTLAELLGAAKKLDRIVNAKRSQQEFHGPIVFVAKGKNVGPHGGILASRAKQNRRTRPPVVDSSLRAREGARRS
jgi:hypothetical protein